MSAAPHSWTLRLLLLCLAALLACAPPPSDMTESTATTPHPSPVPASPPAPAATPIAYAPDAPAPLPTPLPDDPLGVTIHRLSNGLTVYLSVDREQPRISAWIAIRAGSRHDPAHSTGLAHYLEHMMFKGTARLGTLDADAEAPHLARTAALYDRLPRSTPGERAAILADIDAATQSAAVTAIPNELDRLYAGLGILDVNAFTTDDTTVYMADLPAARLAAWARVEAERLAAPTFRLFLPELEAVYEEKNISLDTPEDRMDEALRLALFPRHPYGTQTILGDAEHLRNPALAEMVAYHRRWYLPNNAALILAGDLDPTAALAALELAFATWSPGQLPPSPPGALDGPVGRIERIITAEGEQSVTLAWRTVPAGHPDEPALAVLAELVDNDVSGLLNVRLLLSGELPDADGHGEQLVDGGYFALTGVARDDQSHAEVERLLRSVITDLKAGAFTQADIDAIVLHEQIREQMARESNNGRVSWIADAYLERRSWPEHVRFVSAMARVSRDDILRVAATYLGADHVAIVRKRGRHDPPKMPKPVITPVPIDPARVSRFAAALLAEAAPDPDPVWLQEGRDYTRRSTPAGPLIAAPNHRSDLFSLTLRFELGTRQRPLLGHALDLLALAGAGDLDAEALQRRLFQLGTTIDTDCGADQTRIFLTGVDEHLEQSLALLDTWLRRPGFDDDTVRDLLANTLSLRRDEQDDPEALAEALAEYARRGPASDILTRPGDRQLRQARGPELARELAVLADSSRHHLYFGPRGADALVAALPPSAGNLVPPRPPRSLRPLATPTIFFLHRDMAQAQIEVALASPPLPRSDRPAARLLNQILGGDMSGLVFQQIREARGLAYSASGLLIAGARDIDGAALLGRLGTQADKSREALTLLLEILRAPDPGDDRIAAARVALTREMVATRIPPRRVPDWVQVWAERGETSDPRPWELATLQSLAAPQLQALQHHFTAPAIVSVLADRRRIDLAALRQLLQAELVELRASDIFPYAAPQTATPARDARP